MAHLRVENQLFTLPSHGNLYDGWDLKNGTDVKIRTIVAADQKQMATGMNDQYRMFQQMLSAFVLEPDALKIDDMLLSDAVAILYAVYLTSHGPEFEVKFRCEFCGATNERTVLLTDLITEDVTDLADEGRDFKMINELELSTGDTIKFHLPTVGDERTAKSALDAAKKRGREMSLHDLDLNYYRMAAYLVDVIPAAEKNKEPEPEPDPTKEHPIMAAAKDVPRRFPIEAKENYLEALPIQDYVAYQDALRDADTGVKPQMQISCGRCSAENDVNVVFGANFFRPPRRYHR